MFAAQLEVLAEERVEVVAPALGSCGAVVERFRGTHTKVIALSGKVDHGQRNCAEGADAIVAQGMEAGGHIGSISNFALVPGMVDAVAPVPVIAAGAISDGRGLAAALALGAQGAWIGTAFLAAEEASINDAHKAQIVSGGVSDFVPSPVYAGADVRLYRNDVVRAWQASGLKPLPGRLQRVLMEDFDAAAQAAGRYDLLSNPAGQGAGIIHAVKPAGAIISEMVEVANKVLG